MSMQRGLSTIYSSRMYDGVVLVRCMSNIRGVIVAAKEGCRLHKRTSWQKYFAEEKQENEEVGLFPNRVSFVL